MGGLEEQVDYGPHPPVSATSDLEPEVGLVICSLPQERLLRASAISAAASDPFVLLRILDLLEYAQSLEDVVHELTVLGERTLERVQDAVPEAMSTASILDLRSGVGSIAEKLSVLDFRVGREALASALWYARNADSE